jgi:hypothetical protein
MAPPVPRITVQVGYGPKCHNAAGAMKAVIFDVKVSVDKNGFATGFVKFSMMISRKGRRQGKRFRRAFGTEEAGSKAAARIMPSFRVFVF